MRMHRFLSHICVKDFHTKITFIQSLNPHLHSRPKLASPTPHPNRIFCHEPHPSGRRYLAVSSPNSISTALRTKLIKLIKYTPSSFPQPDYDWVTLLLYKCHHFCDHRRTLNICSREGQIFKIRRGHKVWGNSNLNGEFCPQYPNANTGHTDRQQAPLM